MDLHGQIMNIAVAPEATRMLCTASQVLAYKSGHRDARHAAAELAAAHDAVELPDDGELEAWRSTADDLLRYSAGRSAADLRRAAHLLQHAYLFASKLRQRLQAG